MVYVLRDDCKGFAAFIGCQSEWSSLAGGIEFPHELKALRTIDLSSGHSQNVIN